MAIYKLRHVIWGKSVGFYLSTGLRMPHNAKIVVDKEDYPGQYSNEGETLLVFDVTAQQTAAYIANAPWKESAWAKGPVPDNFIVSGSQIIRPYWDLWGSPKVCYTAYSSSDAKFWDGTLLVIEPARNRVYLLEWNH